MGSRPPEQQADGPEFSRPVEVSRIGPSGLSLAVEASAEERAALAERMGVAGIRVLTADVRLAQRGAGFAVTAAWRAEIVQDCVVTLEPIETRLADTAELAFGPAAAEPEGEEVEIDPLAADPPEPITDGRIDVGEVVAEQLALSIDPYPRKPGAEFESDIEAPDSEAKPNPFAVLGEWGKKE